MQTLRSGQEFWLVLEAKDQTNPDLFGIGGYLVYNPGVIEIVPLSGAASGTPVVETYKFFGNNETIRAGLVNNIPGECGFTITAGAPKVVTPTAGRIIRIRMKAKNVESSMQTGITGRMVEAYASDTVVVNGIPRNRVLPSKFDGVFVEIVKAGQPAGVINLFLVIEPA